MNKENKTIFNEILKLSEKYHISFEDAYLVLKRKIKIEEAIEKAKVREKRNIENIYKILPEVLEFIRENNAVSNLEIQKRFKISYHSVSILKEIIDEL